MNLEIIKSNLKGKVYAPTSKSLFHRALIVACISKGESILYGDYSSDDVIATINALKSLGAKFDFKDREIVVHPIEKVETAKIDCGESGSTLRFILPLAAAFGVKATFGGRGKLGNRPIGELLEELKGIKTDYDGGLPFSINGKLENGDYEIDGSESSQFVSGLMMSMLTLDGEHKLKLKGLKSRPYVDLTLSVITAFGGKVEQDNGDYHIDGSALKGREFDIEGDFSGASFLFALGALNGDVEVLGLSDRSKQGDKVFLNLLKKMNAKITFDENAYRVEKSELSGADFDFSDCPDLAPIAAVVMARAKGISRIYGANRLTVKESDRKQGIIKMLTALGIKVKDLGDTLEIEGGEFKPCALNGQADHRMVMSGAVALSLCGGVVTDCEAVGKSYKNFFDDFKSLGGRYVR